MKSETDNWKEAYRIYHSMIGMPRESAIQKLNSDSRLSNKVREIVLQLLAAELKVNEADTENHIKISDVDSLNKFDISINQIIDQYKLIGQIGEGGMSTVYKAVRIQAKNQKPVAIKIFSQQYGKILHKQFLQEMRILSQLSHPNIINLHHGGTSDDGFSFIVMDYIEDSYPIDVYSHIKKFSVKTIIKNIIKIAKAISHAHNNFIIHRDIKPTNILLNEKRELKVLDFGIAKNINNDEEDKTLMAFTPSFASPEQITGERLTVATDIFSLALVLLTLLKNKPIFGSHRRENSKIKDEKIIDLEVKSLNVNRDLKNILAKALKVNPLERYSNMSKFSDDLVAWLNDRPVKATPDSYLYQFSKFFKRKKSLLSSLMVLFLTLIIGVYLLLMQNIKVNNAAERAEQVKNFLIATYETSDPDFLKGQELSTVERLKISGQNLLRNKNIGTDTKIELLQTLSDILSKVGEYEIAIKYIDETLQLEANNEQSLAQKSELLYELGYFEELDQLFRIIDVESFEKVLPTIKILRIRAQFFADKGDYNKAYQTIDLIKNFNDVPLENNEIIKNLLLEVKIHSIASKPEDALNLVNHILNRFEGISVEGTLFQVKINLGKLLNTLGKYELAHDEMMQLVIDQKKFFGGKHPQLIDTYSILSESLRQMGDYDKSQIFAELAYEIAKQLYGKDSLITGRALAVLSVMPHQRNYALTESQMREVVEIYTKNLGVNHPETLIAKYNLAGAMRSNGKRIEALGLIKHTFDKQVELLGNSHQTTLAFMRELSYAYMVNGMCNDAITTIDKGVETAYKHYKWSHSITPKLIYFQGIVHDSCGDEDKAFKSFLKLEKNEKFLINNRLFPEAILKIASFYERDQKYNLAEKYFKKSIRLFNSNFGKYSDSTISVEFAYAKMLLKLERLDEAVTLIRQIKKKLDSNNPNHLRQIERNRDILGILEMEMN